MTPLIESLYKECVRLNDEQEITDILECIQDAKDEGQTCEFFFSDELDVSGWCKYLGELGYTCEFHAGLENKPHTNGYIVYFNKEK